MLAQKIDGGEGTERDFTACTIRGAGLVLHAVALLAPGCAGPAGGEGGTAAVLTDTGGAIERVVTVVNSPRRSGLRNQVLIQNIVQGLGPRARVLVLAPPEMILDPNPAPDRMWFAEIPDGLDFSIWPQDPFVVLLGPGGDGSLLASRSYGRSEDREMARIVAATLGWKVEESSLFFAGGNLLSDERHLFVGASLIHKNAEDLELSEGDVVARFEGELGRPAIVLGSPPQPTAHMDMVFTPLGANRVALADSHLGAELAELELAQRPEAVRAFEEHAESYFFGHPDVQSVTLPTGRAVQAPPVVDRTAEAIADSRLGAEALDVIAADLQRRGYSVLRVPFLTTRENRHPRQRSSGFPAGYPVLTYNNVLVEREGNQERVYLPEYGFPGLDMAARRIWESAGFEVRLIRGLTTSAMYQGSLRCTVKVLTRSSEPDPR